MRSLLAAIIIMFVLTGCAGPVVISKSATDGMGGVPYCLPRTVLVIDVDVKEETSGNEWHPTATLSVSSQTVADSSCRYILQHNKNDASDDDLKIVVGSNGLLTSLSSESTQQGKAIAEAAEKTLVAVAKLAATEGKFALFSTPTKVEPNLEILQNDVKSRVEAALRRVAGKRTVYVPVPNSLDKAIPEVAPFPEDPTWKLSVSLDPMASPGSGGTTPTRGMVRGCVEPPIEGIVVRGLEPLIAKVQLNWDWKVDGTEKVKDDEWEKVVWLRERGLKKVDGGWGFQGPFMSAQGLMTLPDYGPVAVVQVNRAMFVKTTHKVTLANGTPTNVDINRPSPIAAIATFPADVAEALVNLPAQLVQVRISNIKSADDLAAKKTEVEKAAQKTQEEEATQRLVKMNAYLDASAIAIDAKNKWQTAIGTGTDEEKALALAAAKAMNSANAAAQILGISTPFKEKDFPEQYRHMRVQ